MGIDAKGQGDGGSEGAGGPRSRRAEARPRSIAFTGSASFLGQNLIGLLEEDPRVRRIVSIDVQAPATGGAKTVHREIDLTRPRNVERVAELLHQEKVDTVVHLAFLASPSKASAWAHELESIGTLHALTAVQQAEVRKLVLWSQTLLYGAHPTNPNFLTEKHPLRARRAEGYFSDKIDAEAEAARYAQREGKVVSVLRTAPILGPTVHNYLTRYLARRLVPTLMGFDPLTQFLHEVDAVAAFKLAIDRDVPGTFNIVGDGVLPLSTVIRLAGRLALPLPGPLATPLIAAGWAMTMADAPASFVDYLRYVCVADGELASRVMGFRPAYSTREAVIDYASAQRLRDARLLRYGEPDV
jgi:UDP-glucose 4-epimerase